MNVNAAADAAIVVGLVVVGLDRFGLLDWIKPKSAAETAAELELADRTVKRLEAKVSQRDSELAELRLQRTNEPVLERVAQVAEICAQTLSKLASFNGSLRHIEDGLGETRQGLHETVEAMKTLTGLIAELHDLPVSPRRRGRGAA